MISTFKIYARKSAHGWRGGFTLYENDNELWSEKASCGSRITKSDAILDAIDHARDYAATWPQITFCYEMKA